MWIALIHSIHFDLDFCLKLRAFLVAQMVKNLPAVWETQVWSLGWEDHLEKGMATHSSILGWRIPWTEEPGGLPGCRESDTTRGTFTSVTHWNLSSSLFVSSRLWLPLSSWEGLVCAGWLSMTAPFPTAVLHHQILSRWSSLSMCTFRATNLKWFPPLNSVWISHILNLKFLRNHKGLILSALIEIIRLAVTAVTK